MFCRLNWHTQQTGTKGIHAKDEDTGSTSVCGVSEREKESSQPYGDLTHFTEIAKYRSDSTPK